MIREVKLGDILEYEQPNMYIVKNTNYDKKFSTPVLTAGQSFILGYTNEKENIFKAKENPVIIFDDFTTTSKYVDFDFKVKSSAMKILKAREGINIKYIYYAMKNIKFDNQLHKRYWISEYSKIKLLLPDIKMQEKIVKELDLINKLLDYKKKQIKLFDELIKSQFVEMFKREKINKKGWLETTVGEHIRLLTDFSANGSYKILDSKVIMYDEPNYAYMVRTIDLENKEYKNKVKYITKETYEFLSKSKVYPNDIIMNKIGSAGKVYIMPDLGIPVTLGRNAFLIRFNDNILPIYIYYLLTSDYGKKQIQKSIRGAVTKTITKDDVRKIKISVPPITLQNQFAEIVKQIDKQKFESMIQLEKENKDSINNIIKGTIEETTILYEVLLKKCFEKGKMN